MAYFKVNKQMKKLFSLSWLRFKLATLTIQVTSITVWANLLIIRGEEYMLLRDDIIQTNLYNKGFLIYIICENVVLRNFLTLRVETSRKSEHYGKICWKWNVWYGLKQWRKIRFSDYATARTFFFQLHNCQLSKENTTLCMCVCTRTHAHMCVCVCMFK